MKMDHRTQNPFVAGGILLALWATCACGPAQEGAR
jgi:hypothetical protein